MQSLRPKKFSQKNVDYSTMTVCTYNDLEKDHDNINGYIIRCPFDSCGTRIISLSPLLMDQRVEVPESPEMVQLADDTGGVEFFRIEDAWDFDNIGVTKPIEDSGETNVILGSDLKNVKVERILACSECDRGPLGFAAYENGNTDIKALKYFLRCRSVIYDKNR